MLHLHKLIHAVYADYARSLKLLGFKEGAALFASKAGESGKELLTELKQPKEEVTQEWEFRVCEVLWQTGIPLGDENTLFSWITVIADLCDLSKYC